MSIADGVPQVDWDAARQRAGLSLTQLWLAYFAVGGVASPTELAAVIEGRTPAGQVLHDRMAQALNDCFLDAGKNHPIPYFDELSEGRAQRGPTP